MPWWLIGMLGWVAADALFLVVYARFRNRQTRDQDNADGDEAANEIRLLLHLHPELRHLIPEKNIP